MSKSRFWYVRDGDKARGPYAAAQLKRYAQLGRLAPTTLLSEDGQHWRALCDLPALYDSERAAGPGGRSGILDERHRERRQDQDSVASQRRSARERRQPEAENVIHARLQRQQVWESINQRASRSWRPIAIAAVGVLAVAVIVVFLDSPAAGRRFEIECANTPAPGGVWDSCDLAHIDLSGRDLGQASFAFANLAHANLSYADMHSARLVGSDLRGASLRYSRLHKADLSHADLRGVDLEGADLSDALLAGALWLDGSRCSKQSVGACLTSGSANFD